MRKQTLLAAVLASSMIATGCAVPTYTAKQNSDRLAENVAKESRAFALEAKPAAVREINQPLIDFSRSAVKRKGDVNVKAANAPFGPLISEVARKAGYSVAFAQNVEASRPVTAEFLNSVPDEAIRTLAFMAGYAAVIDEDRRTVTIAETATYTFKIPGSVLTSLRANYTSGGNPSSSSGSSSSGSSSSSASGSSSGSGMTGGSSGSGGSVQSSFSISGSEATPSASLSRMLSEIAGTNAQVAVAESGFVTVKANGQALRRVSDFVSKLCKDAMTQVEIEASIVEVTLSNEFAMGISWERVLRQASSPINIALTAGALTNPNLSITQTGASSKSIIQALQAYSDVKVVSQPRLVAMTNTPANIIEGTQRPYLGSVEQTGSNGLGSSPTVSGELSFVIDGLSFGVVPSVINDKTIQITMMPVLSTVGEREDFELGTGGSRLTGYNQSTKQSFMRIMAESGRTLVLGGLRVGTNESNTSLLTSARSRNQAREIVILMRANIIPAPAYNPLVGESI